MRVVPGPGGRRPVANVDTCTIYGIVHVKIGKPYGGRTIENPYVRFQEHMSTTDALGRAIKADQTKFVVVVLEVVPRFLEGVPEIGTPRHWRIRENSWINRLKTRTNGYNTRREISKPLPPRMPTHGLGIIRRIIRSRHKPRVTKMTHNGRVFLSRDWQRRINYFAGLVNHRPHLVDSYMSQLAPKNMLRMIKHIGQNGIPGNIQKAFNALRKHYLSSFPPPSVQQVIIPKLIVIHQRDRQRSPPTRLADATEYIK